MSEEGVSLESQAPKKKKKEKGKESLPVKSDSLQKSVLKSGRRHLEEPWN